MQIRVRLMYVISVVVLSGHPVDVAAQDVRLKVYHGDRSSRAVEIDRGYGEVRTSSSRHSLVLPVGREVCIEVVNAHPVLYQYALNATVDTTAPAAPDFTSVLSILNQTLDATVRPLGTLDTLRVDAMFRPMLRIDIAQRSWQDRYQEAMKTLSDDLAEVTRAIRQSDQPEPLQLTDRVLVSNLGEARGFGHAVREIETGRTGPFRFNDPRLTERIRALTDTLAIEVRALQSERESLMFELLSQRFTALLEQRNAIRRAYLEARPTWEACRRVESGTNTLHLSVQKTDTAMARRRDVGDSIVSVRIATHYVRPLVEVVPLALARRVSDVASLNIQDGMLTLNRDVDYGFRAGTAAVLNLVRTGELKEVSFGPLLGVGIGGDGDILSDLLFGGAFAVRDWFQIGAAWGFSRAPHKMKNPELLGAAPPNDVGNFSDLLESGWRDGVYLIFNVLGLSFLERR